MQEKNQQMVFIVTFVVGENLLCLISFVFEADCSCDCSEGIDLSKKDDREDQLFPPNYATCVLFFRVMMKAMLIVLGLGKYSYKKNAKELCRQSVDRNKVQPVPVLPFFYQRFMKLFICL